MKRLSTDKPELLRWLQMQGDADRRILAQLWALPPESDAAALAAALSDPRRVAQQWSRLSDAERAAMTRVLQEGGALPAAILEREWGPIRDPARFSNPRAYLQALEAPAAPAERLYMMGLLVRAHDDRGPIFRVLNELRPLLPAVGPRDRTIHVAPVAEPPAVQLAAPPEVERTIITLLLLASDGALTTLDDGALNKASLVRVAAQLAPGDNLRGVRREADWPWIALLRSAAQEAGLLHRATDGQLHAGQKAMEWLAASRAERLAALVRGWTASGINELSLWGGLTWRSAPLALRLRDSRRTILALLATLPAGVWLPVDGILGEIERLEPDFLRRDGRYDTWLIYDARGQLVAGRDQWRRVEGEWVRALLFGVLHWLGLVDAGGSELLEAIRLTPLAAHLLHGAPPPAEPAPEPLSVQGTFEVVCPPGASPLARFQLARIAEPAGEDVAAIYRLTRRSIMKAVEQGMAAGDVLRFLEEHGRGPVPEGVASYIREWGAQVGQLRLEEAALLRAEDALRLIEVRRARGVDLPPVEELTPLVWKVASGDMPALLQQLRRAGFSVTRDGQAEDGGGNSPGKGLLSEHDLKALVTAAYAYARICADHGRPCEISPSMLMRLRKLVPSRHLEAAQHAAEELSSHLRRADDESDARAAVPGAEHYA